MKALVKSLFILIGVAAMAGFLLLGIMMIGNVTIFGISYLNATTNKEIILATDGENKILDDNAVIELLKIKTDKVCPEIQYYESKDTKNVSIKLSCRLQGFTKGDVKKISLPSYEPTDVYNTETGELTLETIEPEGLFFVKNCVIKIRIPHEMSFKNVDIEVGQASAIKINQFLPKENKKQFIKTMSFENLKIKQTQANYSGLTIGKVLSTKTESAINLTVNNLDISTVAGRVNINCKINNNLTIESERGTFVTDVKYNAVDKTTVLRNAIGGNVVIKGNIPSVEFGQISNEVVNLAKNQKEYDLGDEFYIYGQLVVDCNANVQVKGTIMGAVSLNKSGASLRVKNLYDYLTANSGCGGLVVVGYANSDINIGTEGGINLTVKDIFINTCGNAIINANDKPVVINKVGVNYYTNYSCTINTKRGDIVIKEIGERSVVNLTAESGDITAYFVGNNIYGQNNLTTTNSGRINVKFKDGQKFKIFARAKNKSNIKIDLVTFNTMDGSIEPQTDDGGYYYYDQQICGNTDNSIQVNLRVSNGVINGGFIEE